VFLRYGGCLARWELHRENSTRGFQGLRRKSETLYWGSTAGATEINPAQDYEYGSTKNNQRSTWSVFVQGRVQYGFTDHRIVSIPYGYFQKQRADEQQTLAIA
jgi:hypothetical protein